MKRSHKTYTEVTSEQTDIYISAIAVGKTSPKSVWPWGVEQAMPGISAGVSS